jgi:ElaB/YqjD/DUF883 family membrane-anchored ribosome-binding protein
MREETTIGSDNGHSKASDITDAARKVGQGLGELGRALSAGREDVLEPIHELVQQRPLAAVGLAFGVGYVLGGGLFTRMTGRLIGISWRLGGVALAKSLLANLGEEMPQSGGI